jgi:hypothetical protein|tara:strand:+ start:280 stop:537 length:258 start_codon:yes stop_codon:yes gene_type:complete
MDGRIVQSAGKNISRTLGKGSSRNTVPHGVSNGSGQEWIGKINFTKVDIPDALTSSFGSGQETRKTIQHHAIIVKQNYHLRLANL